MIDQIVGILVVGFIFIVGFVCYYVDWDAYKDYRFLANVEKMYNRNDQNKSYIDFLKFEKMYTQDLDDHWRKFARNPLHNFNMHDYEICVAVNELPFSEILKDDYLTTIVLKTPLLRYLKLNDKCFIEWTSKYESYDTWKALFEK